MGGWVKVRSWHLKSGLVSRGGLVHTLCGRWAPASSTQAPTIPTNEKSCESCLRLKEFAND